MITRGEVLVFLSFKSAKFQCLRVEYLTCFSSSLRAFHSWESSFARSLTAMCLKSPLAWRLMENCTNEVVALLTWRSSLMIGHFFADFGSKRRRSLARARLAILISLTS